MAMGMGRFARRCVGNYAMENYVQANHEGSDPGLSIYKTLNRFFRTAGVEIDTGIQYIRCFTTVPWREPHATRRDVAL
jgi:hypothetical protein